MADGDHWFLGCRELKNLWVKARGGSIPPPGTIQYQALVQPAQRVPRRFGLEIVPEVTESETLRLLSEEVSQGRPMWAKARGVDSQVFRGFACGALGAAALRIPLIIQRLDCFHLKRCDPLRGADVPHEWECEQTCHQAGWPVGATRSLAQFLSLEIRGVARAARARTDGSQAEIEEMMSPVGKQID